jgi:hypothetical protein
VWDEKPKEYRTATITAVVTVRIDVRNFNSEIVEGELL